MKAGLVRTARPMLAASRWDAAGRVYRKCPKVIRKEPRSLGELGYIAQHRPEK